jgi:phosphoribosylglycinamide formyltransferase-1
LLPLFSGWLYYGDFVHKAVIESKMKFSGCTVHYVTNEYDSGPIIMQEIVAVEENDTAASLAHKVFEKEKELYPKAIKFVLSLQRKQQSS